jgi:uncharacterized phage protein (TIGR01671 family)
MMRDIKFRGKRIDNGEWAHGSLIKSLKSEAFKITEGYFAVGEYGEQQFAFNVNPDTIGQYTGSKDKNGVEIWEGDVVDCTCELFSDFGKTPTGTFTTSLYEIVWHEDCWAKKEVKNNRWTKSWSNYGHITKNISISCEKFYVVIGNIHDNPELLGVTADG